MTFKDQLDIDNANVFMNQDEFSVEVVFDGNTLLVIMEDVSFAEIGIDTPGLYGHAKILHVAAVDLPITYVAEQDIDLNGSIWTIKDVRDEYGMMVFELFRYTS